MRSLRSCATPLRQHRPLPQSAFKSLPSLSHTIHELRQRQRPFLNNQLDELRTLKQRLPLIALYKDLFPARYKKEAAHQRRLSLANYLDHLFPSFLAAISRDYFPVTDCDVDYALDQFPQIPLMLANFDVESEFDGLPLPYRVTAHLVGHYSYAPSQDELRQLLPDVQFPICWNQQGHWCALQYPQFETLCATHRSPVRHFPLLFLTLAHDTGSCFLDPSYDSGEWTDTTYRWNTNTILDLKRQWQHTKAILKRNDLTVRAIEKNPSHWNTIFRYWEQCCHTPQRDKHAHHNEH